MLLPKDVVLTEQVRIDDRSFPEASHAVTRIVKVEPALDGTITVMLPEEARFVPAGVQETLSSTEYSTLTPATPVLSVADHVTASAWPGVTVTYAPGDLMLTEGKVVSFGTEVVVGVTEAGIPIDTWLSLTVSAFRQTLVLE